MQGSLQQAACLRFAHRASGQDIHLKVRDQGRFYVGYADPDVGIGFKGLEHILRPVYGHAHLQALGQQRGTEADDVFETRQCLPDLHQAFVPRFDSAVQLLTRWLIGSGVPRVRGAIFSQIILAQALQHLVRMCGVKNLAPFR
ncbi:hypothetical protein D3C76_987730 [compost metagenome]